MLTLIPPANCVTPLPPERDYPFGQTPLTVAFADRDDLLHVEPGAAVRLAAVPEISSDDAYLLLPLRARDSLLRAFARGRAGALAAWLDGARVLRGEVERVRGPRIWVGDVWRAADVLRGPAAVVLRERGDDALRAVNALPWVRSLAQGGLLDRDGLATLRERDAYVGVSRRGVEGLGLGRDAVASTFVWSERDGDGVHVRAAICADDDETVTCLLAPVLLAAGA